MSEHEKWAANYDDLTEKQQSLIEIFKLKGELMRNRAQQKEKPRKKAAAVPVCESENHAHAMQADYAKARGIARDGSSVRAIPRQCATAGIAANGSNVA